MLFVSMYKNNKETNSYLTTTHASKILFFIDESQVSKEIKKYFVFNKNMISKKFILEQ